MYTQEDIRNELPLMISKGYFLFGLKVTVTISSWDHSELIIIRV